MRRAVLVSLVVVLAGCNPSAPTPTPVASTSPPRTSASPSAFPSARPSGPLAVVTTGDSRSFWIGLANSDGTIVGSAQPTLQGGIPSRVAIPWISISAARVYYLDNLTDVKYLEPGGGHGLATQIVVTSDQLAGFSVSPDDKRIAVSLLSYTPEVNRSRSYVGMRMYVEDVDGGGNHVDIFSSTTVAEYPIGWVGGRIIVALATPFGLTGRPNPYDASEYHVVDATNGDRLATLCGNSAGPVGYIETFGTMCVGLNGAPVFVRWDGTRTSGPANVPNGIQPWRVAMSPDGTQAAVAGDVIELVGSGPPEFVSDGAWNIFGWIDAHHFAYQRPAGSRLSVFDLQTKTSAIVDGQGNSYRGAFPVAVS